MRILVLMGCLAFSGCGLVGEAVLNSMKGKNPDIKRLELQKETTSEGIQAVKDPAVDEKKAKQIVRLVEGSQRQGHPSFFGAIVSVIHTEEGRRLAGVAMVALGSMVALGLKVASTWGLPGMLASTVKGIQDFKEEYPKGDPVRARLNATLSARHSGKGNMKKMVRKILGEV